MADGESLLNRTQSRFIRVALESQNLSRRILNLHSWNHASLPDGGNCDSCITEMAANICCIRSSRDYYKHLIKGKSIKPCYYFFKGFLHLNLFVLLKNLMHVYDVFTYYPRCLEEEVTLSWSLKLKDVIQIPFRIGYASLLK